MGRWKSGYTYMREKEVFKLYFLISGFIGFFAFVSCFFTKFHDEGMTAKKWLGGLSGVLSHYVVIALVYVFCHTAGTTVFGILLFILFYAFLVVFWIFYK